MRHITTEHGPNIEIEEITHEDADTPAERLEQISEVGERSLPAPPYSALMIPGSRAALMAVVDHNGCLIPICTGFDLLRGCKYFWRASQG
jgi:hypothetical protein